MTANARLHTLADAFRKRTGALRTLSVVSGFDGFVDEMTSVVGERTSLTDYTPVPDIGAFADLIKAAAGRSSLREIIVHRVDPGGCSVNMGDGLLALGIALDCFATLGQPRHAAFDAFASKCRSCHSWGREPGRTLAFEFADGKLMFSSVAQLAEFNPALLDRVLADGVYLEACRRAGLIALTDWTLYPHMTACWRKLQTEVYVRLTHRPLFFLDLVDPSSRSGADIRAMLDAVPGFEPAGSTILGLNGTEANVVARILGIAETKGEQRDALETQAAGIRARLAIARVVVHGIRVAAGADAGGACSVEGPFCASPKKSTGAGDRFNSGYCCGALLGLPPEDCLLLGCASSGFFVREARSADAAELAAFIDAWGRGDAG